MIDPATLKVAELKAELNKRKVSFKAAARKADLQAALTAALAAEASAGGGDKGEGSSTGATKKRKASDAGTTENAAASSSKPKPTKKPKVVAAPSSPPWPARVVKLIQAYFSPLDLRTHLAYSGVNKHIRATCYPDQNAWKALAVGAGYGKPTSGVQVQTVGGKAATGGGAADWKDVVRALVKCKGYGEELEERWERFRDSLASLKDKTPLLPEAIAEQEAILETNPLVGCIEVSSAWTGLQNVTCSFDSPANLDGIGLSSLPSVAYAFATCPPVTVLGIEPGFSHAKNPNGVTILDVFTAHLQKAQETVYEESLLTKFVRDQALKTREKSSWTYAQQTEYETWVMGTGLRSRGWTSRKALMVAPNETFNGEASQEGPGCILLQLGFDGPDEHANDYSDEDDEY